LYRKYINHIHLFTSWNLGYFVGCGFSSEIRKPDICKFELFIQHLLSNDTSQYQFQLWRWRVRWITSLPSRGLPSMWKFGWKPISLSASPELPLVKTDKFCVWSELCRK
jgi:hypothetical protein